MPRSSCRTSVPQQPAALPRLPRKLACLLPASDPAEQFMRGWLSRFHSDPVGLYSLVRARRTEVELGGRCRRLIIEAAAFKPRRRGAAPEWLVIRWCVDGPGVTFELCSSLKQALDRFADDVVPGDVVFSSEDSELLSNDEPSACPGGIPHRNSPESTSSTAGAAVTEGSMRHRSD